MCLKIIYLFQKSRRRPWTSIGRHLFLSGEFLSSKSIYKFSDTHSKSLPCLAVISSWLVAIERREGCCYFFWAESTAPKKIREMPKAAKNISRKLAWNFLSWLAIQEINSICWWTVRPKFLFCCRKKWVRKSEEENSERKRETEWVRESYFERDRKKERNVYVWESKAQRKTN